MDKDKSADIDCAIENIVDYIDGGVDNPPQLEHWLHAFAQAIIKEKE